MATQFNFQKRFQCVVRVGSSCIPRLLPYADVSRKVHSINIGELFPITTVPTSEPVYGRYRRLDWSLSAIAEVLLSND